MALKDRIRKVVTGKDSIAPDPSSSANSSAAATPTMSRAPSTAQLSSLVPSKTTHSSKSLRLMKTTSSKLSLSRFRSKKDDPSKYAPCKFKFRDADPQSIARLKVWDWSFGTERASFCSDFTGISPNASRQNSVCEVEHAEKNVKRNRLKVSV